MAFLVESVKIICWTEYASRGGRWDRMGIGIGSGNSLNTKTISDRYRYR